MLEQIACVGCRTSTEDQTRFRELIERPLKYLIAASCNNFQQFMAELATNNRTDLSYLSRIRPKPIEPSQKGAVQAGWHCRRHRRNQLWDEPRLHGNFQSRSGQFLHKKWHAISPANYLFDKFRWQRPSGTGNLAD